MSGITKGWYDFAQSFNTRCTKIHEWAKGKGFWDHASLEFGGVVTNNPSIVAEKLALAHSELSEGLEAYRAGNSLDDKLTLRVGLEVELADTVIRIMDLAAFLGYDLGGAIAEKMQYNESRPHKHGKAF